MGQVKNELPDAAYFLLMVERGSRQDVIRCIEKPMDLNCADAEGNTPLHLAIKARRKDVALLLIEAGADLTKTNTAGITAAELNDSEDFLCQALRGENRSYRLGPAR